jgi:diguanylate cyclase (GGDEF)-like protein
MKKSLFNASYDDSRYNSFDDYQYEVSLGFIKIVSILAGFFNIILLVVDYINYINNHVNLFAIIIRIVFIISMILLLFFIKKIKTYKQLANILTLYELVATFVFLSIFVSYTKPDLLIQSWGVFVLIFFVFIVPNKLINMVIVSILAAISFLACIYFAVPDISNTHFIAAAVYLLVEIIICTGNTYYFKQYKRGEFIAKNELIQIYSTDPLTKIGNRNKLKNEANKWLEFCRRHNLDLSLVLVDIDDLKRANDEHGHLVGDKILYNVSQIMKNELRTDDVCVRWGGDVFVLLLPDTSVEQARILSERIRKSIIEHKVKGLKKNITCSFGITKMMDGQSLEDMIHQADESMYIAKSEGKNKVV